MNRNRLKEILLTVLVFLLTYTAYLTSGNNISFDSMWSIHTTMSILKEGNVDLDEYKGFMDSTGLTYASETVDGHTYNVYPIGSSLIALPFVAVLDRIGHNFFSADLAAYVGQTFPRLIELLIASFVVSLTAVVIFRIARSSLPPGPALILVFIFAFCTSAWSTASRALWQHGPSMLMLSLALYLALQARRKPALIQFVGLPLALSYVIRPTNSISILLLTLYVFIDYRRYFVRYLLWMVLVIAPFVAFNTSIYHAALSPYYRQYQVFSLSTFPAALIGHLFSPSRGLLIFSPVLLLSIAGVAIKIRRKQFDHLDTVLLAGIVLHWIAISIWPVWWGGWSYGPRMFTDMLPYLIYFMIPVFAAAAQWRRPQRIVFAMTSLLLIVWSLFTHYRGTSALDTIAWNQQPVNVDVYSDRLWDWYDVQFLRGLPWGAPTDLAVSGVPILHLDSATYARLGSNQVRTRKFDATTALVTAPGRLWTIIANQQVINPELANLFDSTTAEEQLYTITDRAPYQLYHFDLGQRIVQAAQSSEQIAVWSPDLYPTEASLHSVSLPVEFGPYVRLIGYEVRPQSQSGQTAIITYWQVMQPTSTPLRLFVHAVNAEGQLVAQDDRLDAPAKYWRSGDLIAQVSELQSPSDASPVWIEIGMYNPESGERLPVVVGGKEVDQRLLLKQITP